MRQYSFAITFRKGVKYLIIFALPFAVAQLKAAFPQIADMTLLDILKTLIPEYWLTLTIGGLIVMAANWLKNYLGVRLP